MTNEPRRQLPTLIAMVLCERIEIHDDDSRTLHRTIGVHRHYMVPCTMDCALFLQLADVSRGDHLFLELLSADTLDLVEEFNLDEVEEDPIGGRLTMVVQPCSFRIWIRGEYILCLKCHSEIIGQIEFSVDLKPIDLTEGTFDSLGEPRDPTE